MTISYNWLSQYISSTLTPQALSTILTSVGLEVENMEKLEAVKGGLEGIVIGKVISCIPHPDADKLKLTTVDIGAENTLQIVCGAPNVAAAQTVVVATIGTTIYPMSGDAITMKKAKIRGVESEGMICAEDELGMGESHDGIIVLNEEITPGTLAKDYYKLAAPDYIYEIGLTPNRMDSMSHIGVAKDVCAYLSNIENKIINSQIPSIQLSQINAKDNIEIEINDSEICPRYAGVVIENIEVKPSPEWLQNRLKSIGLKPINNIVDITNFVLHEIGQPLHAFDRSKIAGNKIVVKKATENQRFLSLDAKEKTLTANDILICNANEAMCIAGVYGGLDSGVNNETTSIFLESAYFTPSFIRSTSMRLGLRTDAAIRFEKGVDVSNTIYALQRAASLVVEIAGGNIVSDFIDVYPTPMVAKTVEITYEKINNLSGKIYSTQQVKNILQSLCFTILNETESGLTLKVPFAKNDISIAADIVEEIMRIDGLDNIPFTGKISYSIPLQSKAYTIDAKKIICSMLVGKGFYEIFTNSITNSNYYTQQENLVKMMNSLSANLDTMRASMMESGLESIAYNLKRKNSQIKFFEIGKVYTQQNLQFEEKEILAFWVSGNTHHAYWNEKQKPIDIFYLKGILENMFQNMKLSFEINKEEINILFQKRNIGKILNVSDEKLKQFDIKQAVFYAEIYWNEVRNALENKKIKFVEIPKYPTVQRDIALVINKEITFQQIEKAIKQMQISILKSINIFDVFENEKLGNDKKSYAINLSFLHQEKTLTDVEVEIEMKKIIQTLQNKVDATIRE